LRILLIFHLNSINAQENCGTDEIHEYLLKSQPGYESEIELIESKILEAYNLDGTQNRGGIVTIPVVVHILHLGENVGSGSNISNAQVIGAINGANNRWQDTNGPGPNMQVEFCLAQRDPSGNPTNGIVRIDASAIPNYASDGMIKRNEIKVLPNPNKGAFYLELTGPALEKELVLSLFDASGRLVDKRPAIFDGHEMVSYQLDHISSGAYFLQIKIKSEVVRTIRFEVQH